MSNNMSGIPEELVQRLVQETLRQARLKAALDPPPAIKLATEEAAAARVEAGLAVPATAEQAMPEEMPRPIYPFLQGLAQPAPRVDDAAGPSTSSVQLPLAEELAKPSTRADNQPSLVADLATMRRSAAEAMPEVRDELCTSRAKFIRARFRMQAALEVLDGFLLEYLQVVPELVGEYPQRVADERAAQAAYRAEHERRADRRALARAVELVRAQLVGFQRATALRSAALQRQLEEAEEYRWRTRRGAPEKAGEQAALRKRCPVCGPEGTTGSGRECSNRSAHAAIMDKKTEDANQR